MTNLQKPTNDSLENQTIGTDLLSRQPLDKTALYIHIPYCLSKCPYCDFNSYALNESYDPTKTLSEESTYIDALCAELRYYANDEQWQSKSLSSIFFGGGTPSLLHPDSIEKILSATQEFASWCPDIEITLECNPGTLREHLGEQKLAAFKRCGINRLSFGTQSIRAWKLQELGRLHSVDDIYTSLSSAASAGYSRVSIDVMYGLSKESCEEWCKELEEILSFAPSHLSAYTLTIEPGTEFARMQRRGTTKQAHEEQLADMYCATQELLANAGYSQYEVSNFAKPGQECRHNLSYWRWESFLALGAGAHGFRRREPTQAASVSRRYVNTPKPSHYIAKVREQGFGVQRFEELSREQERLEVLYCFLRTKYGIPLQEYEAFFNESFFDSHAATLNDLLSKDLLIYDCQRIALTEKGYLFSDFVLGELAKGYAE